MRSEKNAPNSQHQPSRFEEILAIGGKSNSLGKVNDVISAVLHNKSLLFELYTCMFSEDAWVRMRAADAFEKVCRQHPEWIEPYIDKMQSKLSGSSQQASIQWHVAQIYEQVSLTPSQKQRAIAWLSSILASTNIDWIVAANAMSALAYFTKKGDVTEEEFLKLLKIQQAHTSKSVVKKANKFLDEFSAK